MDCWRICRGRFGLAGGKNFTRSALDYFAIATLGISKIMIQFLKMRTGCPGVKNVTGLDRPVPYEVDLQKQEWFINLVKWFYNTTEDGSSISSDMLREAVMLGPEFM
ncbi:MAG: hypothetical protein Ct9H300mP28_22830 [Pseudomonadota bacterium]|nr:MAG: hypothetical protein Ct9H300mP28_22830 [Pseudomonadota bacterium]